MVAVCWFAASTTHFVIILRHNSQPILCWPDRPDCICCLFKTDVFNFCNRVVNKHMFLALSAVQFRLHFTNLLVCSTYENFRMPYLLLPSSIYGVIFLGNFIYDEGFFYFYYGAFPKMFFLLLFLRPRTHHFACPLFWYQVLSMSQVLFLRLSWLNFSWLLNKKFIHCRKSMRK